MLCETEDEHGWDLMNEMALGSGGIYGERSDSIGFGPHLTNCFHFFHPWGSAYHKSLLTS